MTKSYQISKDMDIETIPHVMYFTLLTFINTLQMENFHLAQKLKIVSEPKHLIMLLSTTFCSGQTHEKIKM